PRSLAAEDQLPNPHAVVQPRARVLGLAPQRVEAGADPQIAAVGREAGAPFARDPKPEALARPIAVEQLVGDLVLAQGSARGRERGLVSGTELEQAAADQQPGAAALGQRRPLAIGSADQIDVVRALVVGVTNDPRVPAVAAVAVDVTEALEHLDRAAAPRQRPGCGQAHGPAADDRDLHSYPSAKP